MHIETTPFIVLFIERVVSMPRANPAELFKDNKHREGFPNLTIIIVLHWVINKVIGLSSDPLRTNSIQLLRFGTIAQILWNPCEQFAWSLLSAWYQVQEIVINSCQTTSPMFSHCHPGPSYRDPTHGRSDERKWTRGTHTRGGRRGL